MSTGSALGSGFGAASGVGGGNMWGAIIPAAISALGMFLGGRGGSSSAGSAEQMMTPEMREMLQMQIQRMRGQEPLYNDVMGMARSLLPTRYRGAGAPGAGLPGGARPRTDTGAGLGSASGRPFVPGGGPSTYGRDGNGGNIPRER